MIQTLFAFFSIYSLSSANRLLLQLPQLYVPIPQPPLPQIPQPQIHPPITEPIIIVPPELYVPIPPPVVIPPEVSIPIPPTNPQPQTTPITNYNPNPDLYVPIQPLPQVSIPPTNPTYPTYPKFSIPPTKVECKMSPPDPQSCAGKISTITNPVENFEMLCDGFETCTGATLNINFSPAASPNIERIKGLWFKGEYAAAGAVINISNQRGFGDKIMIEEIVCDKPGACMETQFIIGPNMELEIGNFYCSADACHGCSVRESMTSPPMSCYEFLEPI